MSYKDSSEGVTVDLSAGAVSGGDAAGDTISNFENITGSAFDDTLNGDGGSNGIDGGEGADTIDGGAGDDRIIGGEGDDVITGGEGEDWINVGRGDDRIDLTETNPASDVLNFLGDDDVDTITGFNFGDPGAGGDILWLSADTWMTCPIPVIRSPA